MPFLNPSSPNMTTSASDYSCRWKDKDNVCRGTVTFYCPVARRKSIGPNSGFEIFVPGRQDGFGHNPACGSAHLSVPSVAPFPTASAQSPLDWVGRWSPMSPSAIGVGRDTDAHPLHASG